MSGHDHHASFSSASPYSATSSAPPYARRQPHYPPRVDSPPSSAFFSPGPDDEHAMQPTPGAQQHFGSSTSFRRHSGGPMNTRSASLPVFGDIRSAVAEQGPSSVWDRLVSMIKGVKYGSSPEENGYELASKAEQTPSAKYSSFSAEVRPFLVSSPGFLLTKNYLAGCRFRVRYLYYARLDRIYHLLASQETRLQ